MDVKVGIKIGSNSLVVLVNDKGKIKRHFCQVMGKPVQKLGEILTKVKEETGADRFRLGITGSGAGEICKTLNVRPIDQTISLVAALNERKVQADGIIRVGHNYQFYVKLERTAENGKVAVTDISFGNSCAAGSGAFLLDMVARLNYQSLEQFIQIALDEESPAGLSGRCRVFAESDIVHLYQRGTSRDRIAAGIHKSIAHNFIITYVRGSFEGKILLVGGVSQNKAIVKYLHNEQKEAESQVVVLDDTVWLEAEGALLLAREEIDFETALGSFSIELAKKFEYEAAGPLSMENVEIVEPPCESQTPKKVKRAGLGIDIGSVSTKAVLMCESDGESFVLGSHYRRTDGDPLSAVSDTIGKIWNQIQEKGIEIETIVAATTGSGRFLTADYVGANIAIDEISAQANGAMAFVKDIDSIFEIGGQDSKYMKIKDGAIEEYEMNKACAAGCGAFLDKQAQRFDVAIDEYGDIALRATKPPQANSNCTIFTQNASLFYLQNGVSIEDICAGICIALVKNYMSKDVGGREIGDKIVFQGAVAKNKAMIAAFATMLGKKIIVPPYPHLTGAIGAARMALQECSVESSFRGFETIAKGDYSLKNFTCSKCANFCEVSQFSVKGNRFYYGDRCGRFAETTAKKRKSPFTDLFAEREAKLLSFYDGESPVGARKIGIPRLGVFGDYFPLFQAFFTELGFEVVPSDITNKTIISQGLAAELGGACFPVKVAHGHLINILEKDVDYVFLPAVLNVMENGTKFKNFKTCPYVQAMPEILLSAIENKKSVPMLAPRLHFQRGKRSVEKQFVKMAKKLGKTKEDALEAFEVGWQTLHAFNNWQKARGKAELAKIKKDEIVMVVCARPYTLDPGINMDVANKIQELGVRVLPMQLLPLDEADVSDAWPNTYSKQIQNKLAAARIIANHSNFYPVVLTYFACGPDSFANPFFREEVKKPCCIIQIDEHTADAGIITRIEAYLNTIKSYKGDGAKKSSRISDSSIMKLNGRKLWLPYSSVMSEALAAAFRAYGVDAGVLPSINDPGLNLARKYITEDTCLPMLMTINDMLHQILNSGIDRRLIAIFQGGSQGPCRFGMYHMYIRLILDRLGYGDIPVVTLGSETYEGGLGVGFAILTFTGLYTHDLLMRMCLKTRPHEKVAGECDRIFNKYFKILCDSMVGFKKAMSPMSIISGSYFKGPAKILSDAQSEFLAVSDRFAVKPLIGVIGEFYVRLHETANQDLVREIERLGGEAWLAPATEFLSYSNLIGSILAFDTFADTGEWNFLVDGVKKWGSNLLIQMFEHHLSKATMPCLAGVEDISAKEVIKLGSEYVDPSFGGEAICSMGKATDFVWRDLDGIVAVDPFNCMPGMIVAGQSYRFKAKHGMPFLNLDFDGFVDTSRKVKLAAFMDLIQSRFEN